MMMRCCGDLNKEKPRLDIVRKIAEIDYLEWQYARLPRSTTWNDTERQN
jgi:hypothetical protein